MGQFNYSEGEALLGNTSINTPKKHEQRRGFVKCAGRVGLALLALMTAGGIVMYSLRNRSVQSQIEYFKESLTDYAIGLVGEPTTFQCSGHGVITTRGECLCDLGYTGPSCSDISSTDSPLSVSNPKSVCMVVENFGFMGDARDGRGHSQAELAMSMSRRGYEVTVLYVGAENGQLARMAEKFAERRVTIIQLPSTGVNLGKQSVETVSYEVYQYLLRTPAFSHVIFTASSGTAYYTLQAQKQGLLCSNTRFIVGVDSLSKGAQERIESGDPEYHPVAVDTLKNDFLTQQSIEMADTVVFSSSLLVDEVRAEGINVKASRIISSLPPQWRIPEKYKATQKAIKELVFVGPMTISGGIKIFCDALDQIAGHISTQGIKVTFLGFSSSVLDMTSEEYIELRALAWESYDLQWTIQTADSLKSILNYMSTPDLDKVAVMPSEFDSFAGISQMLYYSGVPFIGSSMSAIKEIIDIADHSRMISNPDGVELSTKISKVINGASAISKPRTEPKAVFSKWLEILQEKTTKTCIRSYEELEEKPLVSVVIVHHNRPKFLQQTIESINAQTYKNIEVVLVDDGSTDPEAIKYLDEISWKWWEEKGWKILREPNRYLGSARNTGARNAAGKFILFVDDDDYSKPHHVETLVRVAVNTKAEIVSSGHDTFSGLRRPTSGKAGERYVPIGKAKLAGMLENVFGDSSMMIRKEYFAISGGFTEDRGVGFEDYEFFARLSLTNATMEAVSEPLHWYRRHSQTMSTKTNLKANQLRMLRPYLAARGVVPPEEKAVLEHTQTLFFERHGISSAEERALFREAQANNTQPSPRPKPSPVKISCEAYLDQSGASGFQFGTVKVWTDKVASWCWDFGTRSTLSDKKDTAALIIPFLQPIYPNGTSAGKGVIASLPCQAGYSDAFAIIQVVVDKNAEFDGFKDYTSLFLGSPLNQFYQQESFYNYPLVPPGSRTINFSPKSDLPMPQMKQAWYEKKPVFYYDMGKIPNLPIQAGSALTSFAVDVLKQGATFGSPVLQYGLSKSTGFYASKFIDVSALPSYKEDDFKSIDQLGTPYQPYDQSRIWNCPIAFTEVLSSSRGDEFKFDGLEPSVIPNLPSVKIILSGSGFSSSNVIYINQAPVPAANVTLLSSSSIAVDIDASVFPGTSGLVTVYIDDSLSYDLYYYNSKAQILSIEAPSLYTGLADQAVSIKGQFLADFPDSICVFNTTVEGVSTPLTVENSTYASCPLPEVEESSFYSVNVLFSKPKFNVPTNKLAIPEESSDLNRQDLFVPLAANASNSLKVLAPAPRAVYAEFLQSGGSIYVQLDNPATVIDFNAYQNSKVVNPRDIEEPFPCSWIFVPDPKGGNVVPGKLSRENKDDDCLVTMLSASELLLELSAEFTSADKDAVAPLRRIYIRSGALWYEGADFSETTSSFVTVQAPEEIETPVIEINAPLYVAACSDIVLDLSETTGHLGRLFTSGQISYSSPSPLPTAQDQSLTSALVAGFSDYMAGKTDSIVVPASALWTPAGADFMTYAFTIKVVNFMNKAASATVLVNRMNDNSAPYVVVNDPSGNPSAGEAITVVASTDPICNIRDGISYRWSVQSCPGLSIPSSFSNAELYIAPFTLAPNTKCELRIESKYTKDSLWRSYPISFTTRRDVLMISPGPSRTVRADLDLIISAEISVDAYSTEPSNLQCRWVCVAGGGLCSSALSSRLTSCRNNVIPRGTLTPQVYNFTVSVTNPTTGSTATSRFSSLITVVSNKVPAVTITPSQVFPSANSDGFSIEAIVDSSSVSSVSSLVYKWGNCASNDPRVSRIDFNRTSNFASDIKSRDLRTLKFAAGTLRPAARYCVSVAVTDGTTNGYAEYRFVTRSAPEAGFCQMSGTKYQCIGFTTDPQSFPLYYSFFVRSGSDQPWSLVQPRSTSSIFDASTLAGVSYQVQAQVSDAAGSIGRWDKVETVSGGSRLRKRQASCATPSCILNQAITNYQQTKNVAAAERALGIATLSIKPSDSNFGLAMQLINSIANDVTVDTQVHGPFLVNQLSNIVGAGYGLQKSDWNSVITLAKQLIVSIKSSGKAEVPANCVGSASSSQLLAIVDQIYGMAVSTSQSDADKKDLLIKLSDVLGHVETCTARRKAAQENPLTFASKYMGRRIGVTFVDQASSYCSFTVGANQVDTSSKTVTYGCGSYDAKVFPNNSAVFDANPILTDVALWDVRQEMSVGLKGVIVTSIPIENSFDAKYKLSTYVIPDPDNANAIDYSKNKYPDQSFRPQCSTFDLKSQEWSTDSCIPQRVAGNAVECRCNKVSTIGLAAKAIPPPSDVSVNSSGSSNAGAIAGGTIAAAIVVAAIAGLVWYLRKKGSANKTKEAPLPTTTTQAAAMSKRLSKKESQIEKSAAIASRTSDTTPGRTAEELEIVVDNAPLAVRASRARAKLPEYVRPPSYEEHLSRRGRSK
ncbi:hypothetical protein HDU67_002921 [Dinochytrium kinnereticum]|nr:hypothetical protein HDU67_002921 [Dinochytrium kinnereticum]